MKKCQVREGAMRDPPICQRPECRTAARGVTTSTDPAFVAFPQHAVMAVVFSNSMPNSCLNSTNTVLTGHESKNSMCNRGDKKKHHQ